jgi:hypothetical protein
MGKICTVFRNFWYVRYDCSKKIFFRYWSVIFSGTGRLKWPYTPPLKNSLRTALFRLEFSLQIYIYIYIYWDHWRTYLDSGSDKGVHWPTGDIHIRNYQRNKQYTLILADICRDHTPKHQIHFFTKDNTMQKQTPQQTTGSGIIQTPCFYIVFIYTRKNLTTCQQDVFATGL